MQETSTLALVQVQAAVLVVDLLLSTVGNVMMLGTAFTYRRPCWPRFMHLHSLVVRTVH